jgi:hypothetical protein
MFEIVNRRPMVVVREESDEDSRGNRGEPSPVRPHTTGVVGTLGVTENVFQRLPEAVDLANDRGRGRNRRISVGVSEPWLAGDEHRSAVLGGRRLLCPGAAARAREGRALKCPDEEPLFILGHSQLSSVPLLRICRKLVFLKSYFQNYRKM